MVLYDCSVQADDLKCPLRVVAARCVRPSSVVWVSNESLKLDLALNVLPAELSFAKRIYVPATISLSLLDRFGKGWLALSFRCKQLSRVSR